MKIDKAYLDEQIAQFNAQKVELLANLNAVSGAIQLCQHLLTVLDMKKPPEKDAAVDLKDVLPEGAEIGEIQEVKS